MLAITGIGGVAFPYSNPTDEAYTPLGGLGFD